MTNEMSWEELKGTLNIGDIVIGTIQKHEPYGVFVDIGYQFEGLIQITDFKDEGVMTKEEYPSIGEEVRAKILGFKEPGNQIWLGVKPSQIR
jgi:ribosomal protein S1